MQRGERTFPGAPITLRGTLVVYLGTMATRLGAPVGLILLALLFSGCGEGEGDGSAGDRAGEEPGAAAEPPSPDTTLPGVPGTVPTPTDSFAGELAITFDDLPWVGPLPPGESQLQPTGRILAALREHDAPAVGFVDCARAAPGPQALRLWLDAGHRLGNHTADHVDLDRAPPAEWIAAARSCDRYLRELTGDSVIYFRYPYLHRGRTRARFTAAKEALAELGTPIAPVTIVTLDWLLAVPYSTAPSATPSTPAPTTISAPKGSRGYTGSSPRRRSSRSGTGRRRRG